jgi:hypothetical protein
MHIRDGHPKREAFSGLSSITRTRSKWRPACTEEQEVPESLLAPADSESAHPTRGRSYTSSAIFITASLSDLHCNQTAGARQTFQRKLGCTLITKCPFSEPTQTFHVWSHIQYPYQGSSSNVSDLYLWKAQFKSQLMMTDNPPPPKFLQAIPIPYWVPSSYFMLLVCNLSYWECH